MSILILSYNYKLISDDLDFPKISGYRGSAFDGDYVYFAPYYNNYGRHGIMLKYDTSQEFTNINSWDVFNVEAILDVKGFQGAVYHNNFVYYVPYFIEINEPGSKILRYDIRSDFQNPASWQVVEFFDSYEGAISEKNFIYFSPHSDGNGDQNTFPLRYDTKLPFTSTNAWESFDIGLNASFIGSATDGKNIYFAPWGDDDLSQSSSIMIYDTEKLFSELSSWTFISVPNDSYSGAGFNGTHVVFPPCWCDASSSNQNFKIMFLNADTQEITYSKNDYGAFNGVVEADDTLYLVPYTMKNNTSSRFVEISNSIKSFNPLESKGGGYWGGIFDGQYVYFAPYRENTEKRLGNFLRYDVTESFTDNSS